MPNPITTNQVDMSQYHCRSLDGHPLAQLYLKNGDRFNYKNGHIDAFYAHDAFFKFPNDGDPADFRGHINMTTNEVVVLCKKAIRNLGYSGPLRAPFVNIRPYPGTNEFTRCFVHWYPPHSNFPEIANIEVDMETKTIKGFYIDDSSMWKEPPKIDEPMFDDAGKPPAPPISSTNSSAK